MDMTHEKETKKDNDKLYYSSYSSNEDNKNETSTNYFSSDMSNSFVSIDRSYKDKVVL